MSREKNKRLRQSRKTVSNN